MLTVFTPVYNRENTLPRLYESLLGQSCYDFEWLIIDDGSTDGSAGVAKGFTGEGKFPVRYIYKENGGKHTAHNLALEEARGAWFWCVDSDDILAFDAVEQVLRRAADTKEVAIASYKSDFDRVLLGGPFPEGVATATMEQMENVYRCGGEFALTFRLDYAKRFPFPVFAGERFVTESVVYDRMGAVYALLPVLTNICEYQPQGYSKNIARLMKNNPNGYCLYYLQRIDLASGWKQRLTAAGKYWCFRYISGNKTLVYKGKHGLTVALGAAVGLIFRVYYKLFRGI